MRHSLALPILFLCPAIVAPAQVSIGVSIPGLSIGINQPSYPEMVAVPGYPVYYAPGSAGNFFFYDGLYWVYQNNEWYSSSWYNGPWGMVDSYDVPLYVLRVPVSYYRQPPAFFVGWDSNAPPRWGEHWGHDWERRRGGWDHWAHRGGPAPAPLPNYQRQFSGNNYPRAEQQSTLTTQHYHYQPKEPVVRARFQQQRTQAAAAPAAAQAHGAKPAPAKHQASAPAKHQASAPAQHQPSTPAQRPNRSTPPPAQRQPSVPAARPIRPAQPVAPRPEPAFRPSSPVAPPAQHAQPAPRPESHEAPRGQPEGHERH